MNGRIAVTFIPLGKKIKFFIRGSRLFCQYMKNEIRRSGTYPESDCVFRVLGSDLERKKFLDKGKPVTIITTLSDMGYDRCDSSGQHEIHERQYE